MAMIAAAFACGLVFGIGLIVSGMSSPQKVLNFLDIAGAWDASLIVVMAAALAVSAIGYMLARRRKPVLADECQWPGKTGIDARLVTGAILFGIGWGLVGLCPGPALVNLATLSWPVVIFVGAMAAGMIGHDAWAKRPAPKADG